MSVEKRAGLRGGGVSGVSLRAEAAGGAKLDWRKAHLQIERARDAIDPGAGPAPSEVRRILEERARNLARPRDASPERSDDVDLVVLLAGERRFAVEARHVLEVIRLRGLIPVPCTPPFVLGVAGHAGRILPVLDSFQLLGLPAQGDPEGRPVVVVEVTGTRFGLLAGGVEGLLRTRAAELKSTHSPPGGGGGALIRTVTEGMVPLLDLEAVAQDHRVLVNEEPG